MPTPGAPLGDELRPENAGIPRRAAGASAAAAACLRTVVAATAAVAAYATARSCS